MKKYKKLLIAIVLILLAAAWVWRYVTMNAYYDALDNGDYKLYELGEMVPFEDDGPEKTQTLTAAIFRQPVLNCGSAMRCSAKQAQPCRPIT